MPGATLVPAAPRAGAHLLTAAVCVALTLSATAGEARAQERVAEIQIHGNHTTPDDHILAISGLRRGDEATEERLRAAEEALRGSGRFEDVELRRRFRSIADPTQILLVILVDEHPAVSDLDLTPSPVKKLRAAGMWLPILHHADGYGFTYGARVSFADALGDRSRVSVPFTWGGERRVALEAERSFDGPVSVVRGSLSLHRRVNPHFDLGDTRQEARLAADRIVTTWLRAGADARVANVRFGPAYEARHTAAGLHATVDTRLDPSFPRNAVHTTIGWERLFFEAGDAARWRADARGYAGVGGSAVLALRAQAVRASRALPFAEQTLLGGSDSLRGYATGHRAGDNMAAFSAELRLPLNSPLTVGRFGVKVFVDAGTVWASGEALRDQRFERGIGGGVYFGAGPVIADVAVAWPEDGKPRGHFGFGVSF